MKPTVTIFADASVDPQSKVGGWACWIKVDGAEAIVRGAPLKQKVKNTTEAELAALANAMAVAKTAGLLSGVVMLQSDCLEGLGLIRQRIPAAVDSPAKGGKRVPFRRVAPHRNHKAALTAIDRMVQSLGLRLVLRHVYGHKAGDGRQWVNRRCDEVAKQHMRQLRDGERLLEGELA